MAIRPNRAGRRANPLPGLTKPMSDGCGSWEAKSMMWLKSIINVKGAFEALIESVRYL